MSAAGPPNEVVTDERTGDTWPGASTNFPNWPGMVRCFLANYPGSPLSPTGRSVMPGSAAKVVITERQQALLRQIAGAATSPVRLAQRAEIILRAFDGQDNQA